MPDKAVVKALPTIMQRLNKAYPNARYELNWENPLQLLVATILAAQCTDERVNAMTPALFATYRDAKGYAEADISQLEQLVRTSGFYRNKARTIQSVCQALVERFNGEVPRTMEEMVTLPGVARKTANVVLNNAFRIPTGVIVDTHVARVTQRMGLTDQKKPEKIELDLMKIVPKEEWIQFGPAMVLFGRYVCTAHNPKCAECMMNDLCPKIGVGEEEDGDEDTAKAEKKPAAAKKAAPAAVASAPKAATATETAKPAPAAAKPAREAAPAPKTAPAAKAEPAAKVPEKAALPPLHEQLPADWQKVLAAEFKKPYFRQLEEFVAAERREHTVFPPAEDVFNAFKFTPYDQVKVLLLGQDPYHDDGQAHGLCFSVRPGVKPPPSLVNIFKELHDDLGCRIPDHGYLTPWAKQGVMLLNAVLTVRAHEPASHKERGWETFTDAVIRALNDRRDPVVFLLWGAYAQKKQQLIDTKRHVVLSAAHPSPLSAKKFFGSKPFSQTLLALEKLDRDPIDWQLPNLVDIRAQESAAPARTAATPAPASEKKPEPKTEKKVEPPKIEKKPEPKAEAKPEKKPEPKVEKKVEAKPAPAKSQPAAPKEAAASAKPAPAPTPAKLAPPAPAPVPALQHPLRWETQLPADWLAALAGEFQKPYFKKLEQFLDAERREHTVYPAEDEVFNAFVLTPCEQVKVVVLGDEPSARKGHDHGLAFSVRPGIEPTPALRNIFQELRNDLGCFIPRTGCLTPWARQGVLLLNEVLTVRAGAFGSHEDEGWEAFTSAVLRALSARPEPIVFLFWGEAFEGKARLIDAERHVVLNLPHPLDSDFPGSRPFSAVNTALELRRRSSIYWQLFV